MEEKERFEILQERMDRKIDIVLEGHQVLHKEIKQVRQEARQMNRETNLKLDVIAQTLSGKIEKVDQKVEINREKIEEVDQKVEINREAIEINRKKIEEVDNKLSTNLENHEERIKVLEAIN